MSVGLQVDATIRKIRRGNGCDVSWPTSLQQLASLSKSSETQGLAKVRQRGVV